MLVLLLCLFLLLHDAFYDLLVVYDGLKGTYCGVRRKREDILDLTVDGGIRVILLDKFGDSIDVFDVVVT